MKKINFKKITEKTLFGSKWLLVPFYLGLVIAQVVYLYWFSYDIIHLLSKANTITKEDGMLVILELVDIVMIANLIKMIISGSYTSFITKDHEETSEKSSSGLLKVKMATSLIGVSSIHLLQSFINAEKLDWENLIKQMSIHAMFLFGALVLMIIEYIHIKGDVLEHNANTNTNTNTKH